MKFLLKKMTTKFILNTLSSSFQMPNNWREAEELYKGLEAIEIS